MAPASTKEPLEQIRSIRKGYPPKAIERLAERLGCSVSDLLVAIQLNPRTFGRQKEKGRLSSAYSERAGRLARIIDQAEALFANPEDVQHWMFSPNPALGGGTPISFLDTDVGAAEVENILLAVKYGVYL